MATDFKTKRINFDPTSGRKQNESCIAVFSGRVNKAAVAIGGWAVEFTNGDHPIRKQEINVRDSELQIHNDTVTFTVDFLLRDNTGNIDDPFKGYVDVVVIADVV